MLVKARADRNSEGSEHRYENSATRSKTSITSRETGTKDEEEKETMTDSLSEEQSMCMHLSELKFDVDRRAPGSMPTYMDDSFGKLSSSHRFQPTPATLEEESVTLAPPKRWSSQETPRLQDLDEETANHRIQRFQAHASRESFNPEQLLRHEHMPLMPPPKRCSSQSQVSTGGASVASVSHASFNSSITMDTALVEEAVPLSREQQQQQRTSSHHMRFSRRLTPIADELAGMESEIDAESFEEEEVADLHESTSSSIGDIQHTRPSRSIPSERGLFQGEASYDLDFAFEESFVEESPVGPEVETRRGWGVRSSITLEAALLGDSSLAFDSPVGPVVETRKSWGVGSSLTLSSVLDDSTHLHPVSAPVVRRGRRPDRFGGSPVRLENKSIIPPPPPGTMNGLRFSSDTSPNMGRRGKRVGGGGRTSIPNIDPCPKPTRSTSGGNSNHSSARKVPSKSALATGKGKSRSPRLINQKKRMSAPVMAPEIPIRKESDTYREPISLSSSLHLPAAGHSHEQLSDQPRHSDGAQERHAGFKDLGQSTHHTTDTAATKAPSMPSRRDSVSVQSFMSESTST